MKILLVRNDNIGDLICTTPAIEALRKKLSDARIDIVVNSYNYDAIDNNPFVDRIYCYTKPKHKRRISDKIAAGFGKLKILLAIRRENYDAVVVFRSGYSRSAELFSNVAGAPMRIGVRDPRGKDHFTHHIDVVRGRHEVEFCIDCLAPFGVEYDGEKTRYHIEESLLENYHNFSGHILFHISSRVPENRYSEEKFAELFEMLSEYPLLISAEPADSEMAERLQERTRARYIQTHSLQELGGLIANVRLFVTLDGGAMHLGPAVGAKTVSISGKTDMDKWYPWGYRDLVIQSPDGEAKTIDPRRIAETIRSAL